MGAVINLKDGAFNYTNIKFKWPWLIKAGAFLVTLSQFIQDSLLTKQFIRKGRMCVCSVVQECPPLCDPMDYSLPGSSVHGIFQARILEWVAISSFSGSSWPWDRTHVSCTGRWILYHWVIWETCKKGITYAKSMYCFVCGQGLVVRDTL